MSNWQNSIIPSLSRWKCFRYESMFIFNFIAKKEYDGEKRTIMKLASKWKYVTVHELCAGKEDRRRYLYVFTDGKDSYLTWSNSGKDPFEEWNKFIGIEEDAFYMKEVEIVELRCEI